MYAYYVDFRTNRHKRVLVMSGVRPKVFKKIFLRNAQTKTIVVKGIVGDGPKHGCVYEYHYNTIHVMRV